MKKALVLKIGEKAEVGSGSSASESNHFATTVRLWIG